MIKFCCCDLKDHSYFLLINTIAFMYYSFDVYKSGNEFKDKTFTTATYLFIVISILNTFIAWIFNVIALFNYIIWDNVRGAFIKFYSRALLVLTIISGVTILGLVILLATVEENLDAGFLFSALITGSISLVLCAVMIWWVYDLQAILHAEPLKEEQKELVQDQTHDLQAKENADEKGVVSI